MEWGNFTYYELISLVFSALAVVATLYIGRHTVKNKGNTLASKLI